MKERIIIDDAKNKLQIQEYIMNLLKNESCSQVDVRRTPLGTRIVIYTTTPGLIIGSRGSSINKLKDMLKEQFSLENPQIDIQKIQNPLLDAKFVAKHLSELIEKGYNYKRLGNTYKQKIMSAGAIGCEIVFSGKLSGEKARTERFKEGYIIKSGDVAKKYVSKASALAIPKLGIINIKVSIITTHPEKELRKRLDDIISPKKPEEKPKEKEPEKGKSKEQPKEEKSEKEKPVEKKVKEKSPVAEEKSKKSEKVEKSEKKVSENKKENA